MSQSLLITSIGQLLVERPGREALFARLGLDYCADGRKPLGKACIEKKLDPAAIAAAILNSDRSNPTGPDDRAAFLDRLIEHIVRVHHQTTLSRLAALEPRIGQLAGAAGDRYPRLIKLLNLFPTFRAELEEHMLKEERDVFPLCRRLVREDRAGDRAAQADHQSVRDMLTEHSDCGEVIEKFRALTDDYAVPPNAPELYLQAMGELADLEADLHRHMHEENNILFPLARG